jgi:hypothetical protein
VAAAHVAWSQGSILPKGYQSSCLDCPAPMPRFLACHEVGELVELGYGVQFKQTSEVHTLAALETCLDSNPSASCSSVEVASMGTSGVASMDIARTVAFVVGTSLGFPLEAAFVRRASCFLLALVSSLPAWLAFSSHSFLELLASLTVLVEFRP